VYSNCIEHQSSYTNLTAVLDHRSAIQCVKHAITSRVHCYMLGAKPTIFDFLAYLQRTAVHRKPPKKRTAIVQGSRWSDGSTSRLSTRSHVHSHAHDHNYCMQSPTKLKQKLTGVVSALESAKKKLKIAHQCNRRLHNRVNSMNTEQSAMSA